MNYLKYGTFAIFAAGVAFGTAGLKLLGSKDAKTAYTHTAAAALRAKESVMTTVTKARVCADDILAEAKEINEKRATDEVKTTVGSEAKKG